MTVVDGDLRRPRQILDHPDTRRLIDFGQPYALLLCAIVHFLNDADGPDAIIATFREQMSPGSHLVLSHATGDVAADRASAVEDLYAQTNRPGSLRPRRRIRRFFDGLEIVDPGVVPVSLWRPTQKYDIDPEHVWLYAGVGRKLDDA
jgi:hypothetical protein